MTESEAKKFLVYLAEQRLTALEIIENVRWIEEKLYLLQEELEQYRAIGTVEELRELKEKATAKKPMFEKIIKDTVYHCRCCKEFIGFYDVYKYKYCPDCGQKLDWSEGKE